MEKISKLKEFFSISNIAHEYRERYRTENVKNLISKLIFITFLGCIGGLIATAINLITFGQSFLSQPYTNIYIAATIFCLFFFLAFLILKKNFEKAYKAVLVFQVLFFISAAALATWVSAYQSEISITQPLIFLAVMLLSSVLLSYSVYVNILVLLFQEGIYVVGCVILLSGTDFGAEMTDNIANSLVALVVSLYMLFITNSTRLQNFSLGESLREQLKKLELYQNMDALTGVMNRRAFDSYIITELERCKKERIAFTLMFIDIDDFSKFNDCYGFLKGDTCISQVAQKIASSLSRSSDKLFRFNGTTFALILPGAKSAGCEIVAARIMNEIKSLDIPHEDSPFGRVTISAGLFTETLTIKSTVTVTEVLELADKSLKKAKNEGKNAFSIHENTSYPQF